MNYGTVFVSYRRADCAYIADSVYRYLREQFPRVEVFRDIEGITPGTAFEQRINEVLSSCNVMLVLIGNDWANARNADGELRLFAENDIVRQEIETGVRRGIPIIPVLVEHADLPSRDHLPESIISLPGYLWIRLDPEPSFSEDLRRLRDAVAAHLPNGRTTVTDVARYLLLIFPMGNGSARLGRVVFYILLVFAIFTLVGIAFPSMFNVGVSDETLMMTRWDALAASLVFIPLTAAIHWFTTRLNAK